MSNSIEASEILEDSGRVFRDSHVLIDDQNIFLFLIVLIHRDLQILEGSEISDLFMSIVIGFTDSSPHSGFLNFALYCGLVAGPAIVLAHLKKLG